jgi:HSP20 family protein
MSRWYRRRRGIWPIDFEVNISGLVAGEPFSIHLTPEGVKTEGLRRFMRHRVSPAAGEREPLVEVIEMDREVKVVAELPGAEKDKIDLRATEERLTINADSPYGRYHKVLELPSRVEPKAVKATYRNGVLEVHLPKKEGGIGEKIEIE